MTSRVLLRSYRTIDGMERGTLFVSEKEICGCKANVLPGVLRKKSFSKLNLNIANINRGRRHRKIFCKNFQKLLSR